MKRRAGLLFCALLAAQGDTLILKDGTHIKGRWWSADAGQIHFLVDNQLHQYARPDVSAVTFGDEDVPLPPLPGTSAPAPTATPSASAPAEPAASAPAPAPAPPSLRAAGPPSLRNPRPPSLGGATPASEPAATVNEPQEDGAVYFRKGRSELVALEKSEAIERKSRSTTYWEMRGARSPVHFAVAPEMQFVVRMPAGIDPATISLYPLMTASGNRRTRPDPGRRKPALTLILDVDKQGENTYVLTAKDLVSGEYAFSRDGSNDAFCFALDDAPGK